MLPKPAHLDLKKDHGLAIEWQDGTRSFYPIAYLRKMSPSAETRHLREEMARNPLTVLPASAAGQGGPLAATGAEMVGNYALRIRFSDGHDTGIYSWQYLFEIDPDRSSDAPDAADAADAPDAADAADAPDAADPGPPPHGEQSHGGSEP